MVQTPFLAKELGYYTLQAQSLSFAPAVLAPNVVFIDDISTRLLVFYPFPRILQALFVVVCVALHLVERRLTVVVEAKAFPPGQFGGPGSGYILGRRPNRANQTCMYYTRLAVVGTAESK